MVVINSQNVHCYLDTETGPFFRVMQRKKKYKLCSYKFRKSSRTEVFTVLPENNAGLCLTFVI